MTDVSAGQRRAGEHRADAAPGGPDDDGLATELVALAGRRWWNRWTVYLGAVALAMAGFAGGVLVEREYGTPASGSPAGARPGPAGTAGFPGGRQQGDGAPGGVTNPDGATGAAATTGTVKLVDGTTLYVQSADGTVITVRTTDDTAVRVAEAGVLTDLKVGDPVTVQGADSAGTVTATTITATPE
ncbi:hypothetical protein ACQPYA_10365 [Micromonospora sp. CA-263727]|uniref:hypothetical protein n=1 Tax=Micromonospora sp. CA-263727 TaxID=3239967 RepID=UPI003D8CEF75